MTTGVLLTDLAAGLAADALRTEPHVLAGMAHDQARFSVAGTPLAAAYPTTTREVAHVLRVASTHRAPVVPQGARTGLAGGANAVDGCVLLSLERMDRILRIDTVERLVEAQAGVTNAALSKAVLAQGLFYPPDPSSWEWSTLGGNLATDAGGLCCVKYGVTSDYVRALEVVLADGSVLNTGRATAKGVAGYDLTRLLVGSEGTLGVITSATMALRPAPEAALTAVATFTSVADAARAVTAVMSGAARPSLLELMDAPTIRAVNALHDIGVPDDTAAILLAQSDRGERAPGDLAAFATAFADAGAVDVVQAADAAESELLLAARRAVAPALERLGTLLVDDVCVPLRRLADLVDGVAAISARHGVLVTCSGHAGDGNMHPTVVFDATDTAQTARAEAAFAEIMRLGLGLGGTITGEHGVGVLKRSWLPDEIGALGIRLHRDIKRAFDPLGILNPGKVFQP